jgi:hypothetical protein
VVGALHVQRRDDTGRGFKPTKRGIFPLIAGLVFAALAIAQDLPPGVLLLSQVKRHVQGELQRLPNVSCLETVHRQYRPAKGPLAPLDPIRLEVLTNGNKELYASPGDRKFSENHPSSFAGSGALGDGLFGLYLRTILVTGSVSNRYIGEEAVAGRRLARWDYRLPVMWSGQTVQTPEGSGKVGLHGSYWADPQTLDVARLELDAEDIPPAMAVTEMVTAIDYARTRLGDNLEVLLPESAEFRLVKASGETFDNRIEFTHCRVYGADTSIDFGAPGAAGQPARFGAATVDDTLRPLPAGLEIAVKLRSRVTSDMAVGALIDGVVASNAAAKGTVVIAAGSAVRGRIRRLEHYADPIPYIVVGLEFTEVEQEGIRYRFFANVVEIGAAPGVEQALHTTFQASASGSGGASNAGPWAIGGLRQTSETIRTNNLPGVATFFFHGDKLDLPVGFRTLWKTLPLAP